tara:strand:- start:50 stop:1594 length:1545 start_codon:yes stop_codon:yes gene_type:complete
MESRFEVSSEGMRLLHEGRPLWQLVKELVSNSWDESVTKCNVHVNRYKTRGVVEIIVEDDGDGFSDIADSYTLMKPTTKQSNPNVRGRFNLGEKELISIAKDAVIETVGHTVTFPENGGRVYKKNKREKGTIVTAHVKGKNDEVEYTLKMLSTFIVPDNIEYRLFSDNVEWSYSRDLDKVASFEAPLRTILSKGINQPLTNSTRKGTVDVYKVVNSTIDGDLNKYGAIYEMGIFVQHIEAPYQVNVNQKVPMPPNRDVVSDKYLQDVYAEILMRVNDDIAEKDASASWINIALEDERIDDKTIRSMMTKQLGDKAYLWSSDLVANDEAIMQGMDIVHARTLSPIIRGRFQDVGLVTTHETFGLKHREGNYYSPPINVTDSMQKVANYARWISKQLLGFSVEVQFEDDKVYKALADYKYESDQFGTLTFNVAKLPGKTKWFKNCPTEEQTHLIVHELGHHHEGNGHQRNYNDKLTDIATKAIHKLIDTTSITEDIKNYKSVKSTDAVEMLPISLS